VSHGCPGVSRRARCARLLFSRRRVRLMSQVSGVTLIGGGVWLAVARSR
jgi:threonine/homoserine/homoserine lactone efflux protein